MSQGELWEDLPATEGRGLVFKAADYPLWTEHKAKLIARYLYYFVLITKHGLYIDGFAAPQEPDIADSWSAKLVLESQPKYLRDFYLCDLDPKGADRLRALRDAQPPSRPKRSINVLEGDFNTLISEILASGRITDKTASFCLIDQRTFECKWSSLEQIAAHKQTNKIELFYFLATGWLDRAFSALTVNRHLAAEWWGRADWNTLEGMPGGDRAALFAKRFREELGYTYTYAWPIFTREKGAGSVKYHMIHATDHPEAPKIMNRAYRHVTDAPEPIEQLVLDLSVLMGRPIDTTPPDTE